MKQVVATLFMLLCLAGGAPAENPQPKITGELKAKPYTLVRLKAENVCERAGLRWRIYPQAGVDQATTPRGLLEFVAPPGTYDVEVLAIGVTDGVVSISEARVKVTVGDTGPTPPKPPEPTPPVPPVPPEPTDPLARDLAALYVADPSTTKVPDLLLLVELYKQAADLAKSDTVTSLGQLSKQVADAGLHLLPRTRLTALRERIGKYLAGEFGDEDRPLSSEIRVKAATVYNRVAKALQQIGGAQ